MFQYLLLLFCLSFCELSIASSKIEGLVLKQGHQIYIQILPERLTLPLEVSVSEDRLAIERLENGDHIFGYGRISKQAVKLDTLYFVGLQKILGVWQSLNWEMFEFKTFEDLAYWGLESSNGPYLMRKLNYTLAPTTSGHWSILMVDSKSVEVGRLQFKKEQIHLEVVNQKDGSVSRSFYLTPIALREVNR